MKKTTILCILILGMAGALAPVPAFADSLYSIMPPGNYFSPDKAVGRDEVVADPFTLSTGGTVSSAKLALNYLLGTNTPVDVYIETDNGGVPGSVVASLAQVGTITPQGGLVTFTCSGSGCTLEAGSYWLVAFEPDSLTSDFWNAPAYVTEVPPGVSYIPFGPNLYIPIGNIAINSTNSYTGPWTIENNDYLSAFEIDGTPGSSGPVVPEPSSIMLLGSGLAALAGLIKRKLMA